MSKTYSVENGHEKKEVTFSIEEPLPSQSPTSYSSDTPVGYAWMFGWFEKSLFDEIANKWENLFAHRPNLVGTDIPLPSQSPTSYRKEASVCRDECKGPYVECLEACNRDKDCEDYCKAKVSGCMRSCLQNRDEPNDAPVDYYSE
ncbi:hypothetical protein ASM33_02680 [Wolbachia endosymbiont of Folsomia candida]|nr:hypothetical protein ASM33_02680 [Wolbachia endosymbiont of Folsomia candida]